MNIQDRLRINHEELQEQYRTNAQNVSDLQATLLRDILPSIKDELELGPDTTDWTKEWLHDTFTLFRVLRRNNFTRSFALESIRKNILWRLTNLRQPVENTSTGFLRCLPFNVLDPFGRPIIILKLKAFNQTSDVAKPSILRAFETLRINLKCLNDKPAGNFALQYIALFDLEGFLLQNLNLELVAWTFREVTPHYPGMLAGGFMLNYSWTHSGLWAIAKRFLSASALSRIFFPTSEELLQYLTSSALPEEYGGTLPFQGQMEDLLGATSPPTQVREAVSVQASPQTRKPDRPLSSIELPPTSSLNPFFGYPVSQVNGITTFSHGRRRKRDLAETLALLFWIRWRKHISLTVVIVTIVMAVKIRQRRDIRSFLGILG